MKALYYDICLIQYIKKFLYGRELEVQLDGISWSRRFKVMLAPILAFSERENREI